MIWWSWFRLVKYGHHLLHMSHMVRFAIREYYYLSGEQENVWYWIKYFFPQFLKKTSGFIKLYHLGRIIPVIFCIDDAKNQLLNYSFIRRQCGTFTKMLFSEKCVTRYRYTCRKQGMLWKAMKPWSFPSYPTTLYMHKVSMFQYAYSHFFRIAANWIWSTP